MTSGEVETRLVGSRAPRARTSASPGSTARALPNSPETDEVFVEIENFGARRQSGSVELSFEGRLLDVKPFDLAPGERRADVYPALAARTGIANPRGWLTAHLDPRRQDRRRLRRRTTTPSRSFPRPGPCACCWSRTATGSSKACSRPTTRSRSTNSTPDAFQPAQAAGFDAVVLDDFLPAGFDTPDRAARAGNFLFLHRAPLPAADPARELEHPPITDLDAASPLLRLVNLRDVTVLRAQAWTLPEPTPPEPGGWRFAAPVRSLDHPLVVSGERGRSQRFVALAFGAADSDLPLRVAFPLFIHNAVELAGGARRRGATRSVPVPRGGNDPARGGRNTLDPAATRLPTRSTKFRLPSRWRARGFSSRCATGFYLRRGADGADSWLAVNTSDREMSALNAPVAERAVAVRRDCVPLRLRQVPPWDAARVWPPWVYLALVGFVLCALEWWGFHRRRTE